MKSSGAGPGPCRGRGDGPGRQENRALPGQRPSGRPPAGAGRYTALALASALALGLGLGLAACSQSDAFIGAQLDHQLRQGSTPTLDLAQVGPANWTRACVLGPGTSDARAAELLGFPWELGRRSDVARRDDRFVLAFSDGRKVLGFVERMRADGDFTTLQPPCFARDAARFVTRRDAGGRLAVSGRAAP
ncbi:MAG: hypothetical protein MUF07_09940 [Steroidobacteraceae bacterium]|jgi:hypothetical protein|nr:hypothetical protein [Steroidobacteraceae bacterium]